MPILIGIDNGNARLKTENFALNNSTKKEVLTPIVAKGEHLIFQDECYIFPKGTRTLVKHDKTEDEENYILTLLGIAREINYRKLYHPHQEVYEIDLAVGTTPLDYNLKAKAFKEYLLSYGDEVSFKYFDPNVNEVRSYTILLRNVEVYQQGLSLLASEEFYERFEDVNLIDIDIVDIGSYTTDYILLIEGQNQPEKSKSFDNMGTIRLFKDIELKIKKELNIRVSERHIERFLVSNHRGNISDKAIQMIESELLAYSRYIFQKLKEDDTVDFEQNGVAFMGGGSVILKPYLMQCIEEYLNEKGITNQHIFFFEDIKENAKGYAVYLMMSLGYSNYTDEGGYTDLENEDV